MPYLMLRRSSGVRPPPSVLGRMSSRIRLLSEAQRAGMTIARPWSQHEQQASVGLSEDLATLLRSEFEQGAGTAGYAGLAA